VNLLEAMQARHSVRKYSDKRIEGDVREQLEKLVEECNSESGLSIQLCLDDEEAFTGLMAMYGNLKTARNYVALVGKKGPGLDEACGYYGQKIVLEAQRLGLNTCWLGASYNKKKAAKTVKTAPDEKMNLVIAIGYGETQGVPHKNKPMENLYRCDGDMPRWFRNGMEAAMLAPTAINQQKFLFTLEGNTVSATAGTGPCSKVDLGIVKYHFEIGAGSEGWQWG
jgi:nitroreductase